jgi:hypothetical protein
LTHQGRSSSSGVGSFLTSVFTGTSFFKHIGASFFTRVSAEEEPVWPWMTTPRERAAGAW